MTAFALQREHMPPGIFARPVDARGYVIPWFVDRRAPKRPDGNPDFRIMDGKRLELAIDEHRCWVCGWRIPQRVPFAFLAGPMCGINRISAEPPSHVDCARWSARACPFLSFPKRQRDEDGMPAERKMAGVGILRNPGVAMVWICTSYALLRQGGWLFSLGDPQSVEWVREGRDATHAEVLESVRTGLPFLQHAAEQDGAEAVEALLDQIAAFMPLLPPEERGA
jgi:hypothetical protein